MSLSRTPYGHWSTAVVSIAIFLGFLIFVDVVDVDWFVISYVYARFVIIRRYDTEPWPCPENIRSYALAPRALSTFGLRGEQRTSSTAIQLELRTCSFSRTPASELLALTATSRRKGRTGVSKEVKNRCLEGVRTKPKTHLGQNSANKTMRHFQEFTLNWGLRKRISVLLMLRIVMASNVTCPRSRVVRVVWCIEMHTDCNTQTLMLLGARSHLKLLAPSTAERALS
ncbi:hypothetical protein CC1G_14066 [Coprinopsis cinerea okayama7|uniref:Uncharacterized protein n=1 Tax=Coprinopsis cinerea (strain Okayama-7 / 130 / ATCC MYA-4618 / FGSC 9003) TaxID=240176 RepID=D6RL39_COPC7|nr:hypothetical protein CC1G_14066 [Coprinopsis cinerea okayama7\|eukprot:XP_002911534.1 hypothetical protein CC1G_14066 [Coprinopsis cinerea okayama7\